MVLMTLGQLLKDEKTGEFNLLGLELLMKPALGLRAVHLDVKKHHFGEKEY